ncbi:response regulator [Paracoccus tibetensis]|uniref:response regulator n=1 Tax=Paracoccus tibetensis TaxID=336292 RepID=UPI001FDFAB3C|nr:response regulator [Paracoccus tibetensis]
MDRYTPYALVVDDDPIIRMDARAILKDAGFRCFEAATPEQAFDILDRSGKSIRLLFSDVNMPPSDLTGFDLAHRCARDWPEISILIASGGVTPEPGDMPEKAEFITKPFSADVVREHLRRLLPDGRQPTPLREQASSD